MPAALLVPAAPDVVLVMVGVVTAEGIGKMLHPSGNIFESVTRALVPLLARRKAQGYNSLIPGAREAALRTKEAANDAASVLEVEARAGGTR